MRNRIINPPRWQADTDLLTSTSLGHADWEELDGALEPGSRSYLHASGEDISRLRQIVKFDVIDTV